VKPPGKTTLFRMQQSAYLEAERIEISQDARVRAHLLKEPMPDQVAKRDDFAGIVRMIDAITSDQTLLDMLQRRMEAIAAAGHALPAVAEVSGDVAIDPRKQPLPEGAD
jgi:hypothetical protein